MMMMTMSKHTSSTGINENGEKLVLFEHFIQLKMDDDCKTNKLINNDKTSL